MKKQSKKKKEDNIIKRIFSFLISDKKRLIDISIVLSILILISIVFFSHNMILFYDSYGYYINSKAILHKVALSRWFSVRGFSFPLIIASYIKFFGDTLRGLTIGSYLFYILLLILSGYIIKLFVKQRTGVVKFFYNYIFILFFVLNVIILGYSHTLLTESVMPLIYLVSIIAIYKWIKNTAKISIKKEVALGIILPLLSVFIWFIKQPYLPAFLVTVLFGVILSSVLYKSKKIFLQKGLIFMVCCICLVASIKIWDAFISKYSESASELNSSYSESIIVSGLNVYYHKLDAEQYCSTKFIDSLKGKSHQTLKKLYKKDKSSWCSKVDVYELKDKENIIGYEILNKKGKSPTVIEQAKFWFNNLFKHPKYVFLSYFHNYLAIIDIEGRDFTYGYSSDLQISQYAVGENGSNGMVTFNYPGTSLLVERKEFNHFKPNVIKNKASSTEFLLMFYQFDMFLFRLVMLLILPIFIASIIIFFKEKSSKALLLSLLSFLSFIDVMFHLVAAAVIDRYVYPVYPLMLIATIICINGISNKRKEVVSDEKR